jgi:transposase
MASGVRDRRGSRRVGGTGRLYQQLGRLERENAAFREQVDRLQRVNQQLQTRVRRLTGQVEELRRAAKRRAAPFSKNTPTRRPGRPGRKPGAAYGRRARRPAPQRVDRVVSVGLPAACPHCGDQLAVERVAWQYQEDLPSPRSTVVTRYDLQIGRCRGCRRRIQPRHPEQTSDALGAAGVQVGPRAVALAVWASKGLGLPAAKVARLLGQLGLQLTPGGVVQALHRAGRRATPTWNALVGGIRASPVVAPDETGWRVAGHRAWLWAFAGQDVVVYRIAQGRGFDDAKAVLGADYAGVLERDGWAPYRRFATAAHQTCLAHLLRRCRELLDDAQRGQAKTPHAVRRILQAGLAARAARDADQLDAAQVQAEAERLGAAVDRLLAGQTIYPPNRRLLDHLARERSALFTFLAQPEVQATNWRAEHAIRPAVVCRKAWGGNRTWTGAVTWQVLSSVLATAHLQQRDPLALLVPLLRAPGAVLAELAIPGSAGVACERRRR